jgi:hypothetical protein
MTAPSRYYSNIAVPGVLSPTLTSSDTGVYLTGTPSGYPGQYPFTLVLDPGLSGMEAVSVNSGAGTSANPWVVERGFDGTTASAHTGGVAVVQHEFTAYDAATSRSHEASGAGSGVHGLPASAWDTAAYAVINETTLTNSSTAIQTFSDIPATYTHLLLIAMGRLTETSALTDYLYMQLNGDSSASYSFMQMESNTVSGTLTSPTSTTSYGLSSMPFARWAASEGGSGVNAGAVVCWIPWYANTSFNKLALSQSGAGDGTSALVDGRLFWGFYNPASQVAVSSLSIACPADCNFKSGTSFGLYGLS